MTLALEGIKVLDLCHLPPGMYCTMILSDLGAEVLRVERPAQGASSKDMGNSPWNTERVNHVINRALNRNKKSMALNLKSDEARQIFYKLAKSADVIVEGFKPGVTARLGIDYHTIKEINPKVVYCSLSGYGQDGPYVDLPGHDINYISFGGALGMIGEAGGPPAIPMNFVADLSCASLNATIGILSALMARNGTGKGQYVDISFTDCVASLITMFAFDRLNNGVDYPRGSTPFNGGFPGYNVYQTKEGKYISIGCAEPWGWESLCHFIGRKDFIPCQYADGEKREEMFAYMRQFFTTRNRDEWFDLIKDKNIPVGKVYSIDEVFSDPQLKHRQMLHEMGLADGKKERTVCLGIKLSDTPAVIRSPSPVAGEHTKEILLDLGYTEKLIKELAHKGTIVLDKV